MKGWLLLCVVIGVSPLVYADTPDVIANIYDDKKISTDIKDKLETSMQNSKANSAPSPAAQELARALDEAIKVNEMADIQKKYMQKYKNALSVELRHVNMSIDSSVKFGSIKFLYSDLLSVATQRELLYQAARMLSLQEDFSEQIEKEFKSGVQK